MSWKCHKNINVCCYILVDYYFLPYVEMKITSLFQLIDRKTCSEIMFFQSSVFKKVRSFLAINFQFNDTVRDLHTLPRNIKRNSNNCSSAWKKKVLNSSMSFMQPALTVCCLGQLLACLSWWFRCVDFWLTVLFAIWAEIMH